MHKWSRWPCCYIKRMPRMETRKRHCEPQIYWGDFIHRGSQTFTTFFRPIKGSISSCNTGPAQLSRPLPPRARKIRLPIDFKTQIEYLKYIVYSVRWSVFQVPILTHWGRVTHICVSKLSILGSDNGLSPGRRQAIIWTNDGILLIGPQGTNFNEILIEIRTFSFKKMSSGKLRPFCLGLNVLTCALRCPWISTLI